MRRQLLSLLVLPFMASASTDEQMILPSPQRAAGESFVPVTFTGKPSLADLLTIESSATIFYSYAREVELSRLFSDSNARTTVLVPTNKAVIALPRKPHEGSKPTKDEDGVILTEAEFDKLTKDNVERWISAHIIPHFPIPLSINGEYETLLPGKNVTFTPMDGDKSAPEWTRVLLDDSVRLSGVKEASNGMLYILDGTIKFD